MPVKSWQRVPLTNAPLHALRNYVLCEFDFNGRTVHAIATHVDFKTGGDAQLAEVIRVFLAQPEPAILMGDLNHPRVDPQISKLLSTPGVCDAVEQVLDERPAGRIDWIVLRGLQTVDAGVVDIGASDHPAYWAEVK
jgi:endonuclease/exonuclease/phosphatase family metal-dependent hydrolase